MHSPTSAGIENKSIFTCLYLRDIEISTVMTLGAENTEFALIVLKMMSENVGCAAQIKLMTSLTAMTGRISFPYHRLNRTWKGASPLDQFAATIIRFCESSSPRSTIISRSRFWKTVCFQIHISKPVSRRLLYWSSIYLLTYKVQRRVWKNTKMIGC